MYDDLRASDDLIFDDSAIKDDFTFSKVRVRQVYTAIIENGLDPFDDYGLAKLLSILTVREFEVVCVNLVREFGISAQIRLNRIEPLYRYFVEKEIKNIRKKDIYRYYLDAISNNVYQDFFKKLTVEELADIRKVVVYSVDMNDEINRRGNKKVFDFITHEIKARNIIKIASN